jgi:hypothetical protein
MLSSRSPLIVVIAPPDYTRGSHIVDALYDMGWDAVLAETLAQASRAADAAACAIVLTRNDWRDPLIVAAIRTRPAVLIPLLAEPMPLPKGPWTASPIDARLPAQEIAGFISDASGITVRRNANVTPRYTPSRPRDRSYTNSRPTNSRPVSRPRDPEQSMSSPMRSYGGATSFTAMAPNAIRSTSKRPIRKKPSQSTRIINSLFSFVLLLAVLGGGYYLYSHPSTWNRIKGKIPFLSGLNSPGNSTVTPYTTNIPGPDCDKGAGKWQKGTTSANFTFTCQGDGLLVTQSGDYDHVNGVYFQGTSHPLSANYHVEVTAAIQSTDASNIIGVMIHAKNGGNGNLSGGQFFAVHASGEWDVYTIGSDGAAVAKPIATGILAQMDKTLTFVVDTNGPLLSLSINGNSVGSIADGSSLATDGIGLVVTNKGGANPLKALFSKFVYKPLPASTISPTNVLATVTAQAGELNKTKYTANVPGPGCDKGSAQWGPPSFYGQNATVTCDNNVMTLKKAAGTGTRSDFSTSFLGVNYGQFPANYTVSVTVDPTNLAEGCFFIGTHNTTSGAYWFVGCQDGSWEIDIINGAQKTMKAHGTGTRKSPYTVVVADTGASKTFTISGTAHQFSDSSLTATDNILLGIIADPALAASAAFSNFSFEPAQ